MINFFYRNIASIVFVFLRYYTQNSHSLSEASNLILTPAGCYAWGNTFKFADLCLLIVLRASEFGYTARRSAIAPDLVEPSRLPSLHSIGSFAKRFYYPNIGRVARDFVVGILKFDSNLHNAPAAARTQI